MQRLSKRSGGNQWEMMNGPGGGIYISERQMHAFRCRVMLRIIDDDVENKSNWQRSSRPRSPNTKLDGTRKPRV